MGTSSSSKGPKGKSSLLPTFYQPGSGTVPAPSDEITNTLGSDDGNNGMSGQDSEISITAAESTLNGALSTGDWKDAKIAFTRYTNSTQGSNIKKAASAYVKNFGSARRAATSASRGIAAGKSLFTFLGSVSAPGGGGYEETLTSLGLAAYIGQRPEETLAKIADAIAPAGATNDEAIARKAILTTLDYIYTKILEQGGDLTSLESLTPEVVKEIAIEYVSNYIFGKWIYELGLRVEQNAVSEKQAIEMEAEIRSFVQEEVRFSLKDREIRDFDLNRRADRELIDSIFLTAYSTLEQ